jgi:hypothetical protein
MKNVVYVLGAGFSAYAGLPVMSNFIEKAKDIYFSDILSLTGKVTTMQMKPA